MITLIKINSTTAEDIRDRAVDITEAASPCKLPEGVDVDGFTVVGCQVGSHHNVALRVRRYVIREGEQYYTADYCADPENPSLGFWSDVCTEDGEDFVVFAPASPQPVVSIDWRSTR